MKAMNDNKPTPLVNKFLLVLALYGLLLWGLYLDGRYDMMDAMNQAHITRIHPAHY